MASMSGMALSTARRNRSPGGASSQPRGSASRASETFVCKSTVDISFAYWSQAPTAGEIRFAGREGSEEHGDPALLHQRAQATFWRKASG